MARDYEEQAVNMAAGSPIPPSFAGLDEFQREREKIELIANGVYAFLRGHNVSVEASFQQIDNALHQVQQRLRREALERVF